MRLRLSAVVAVACLLAVPVAGRASSVVIRVWPLGDSITLGSSWPRAVPGGYRTGLDEILTRDGYPHLFVGTRTVNPSPTLQADGQMAHDGHGGFRIDQVLRDLDGVAHTHTDGGGHWLTGSGRRHGLEPDVAIIHLGTNDILQDWDTRRFPTRTGRADLTSTWQRARFVADLTGRLQRLINRVHVLRPGCRLVVATIVPIGSRSLGLVTSAYAESVRRLVHRLRVARYPVALADLYAAFTVAAAPGAPVAPGLLSADGVHPSAAGYAVMARVVAAAVTA